MERERKNRGKIRNIRNVRIDKEVLIIVTLLLVSAGTIPIIFSFKHDTILEQNIGLNFLNDFTWKYENYPKENELYVEIECHYEEVLFFGIMREEAYQLWVQEKELNTSEFYVATFVFGYYNDTVYFNERVDFYFLFLSLNPTDMVNAEVKIERNRVWLGYHMMIVPMGLYFVGAVVSDYPWFLIRFKEEKKKRRRIMSIYKHDQNIAKIDMEELSNETLLMYKDMIDKESKLRKWKNEGFEGYGEDEQMMTLLSERGREQVRFCIRRLEEERLGLLGAKIYTELEKRDICLTFPD